MNILKALFSSGEMLGAVSDVADAVYLSPEEKLGFRERMYKLYEPFKLAQRLLSLIFGIPYASAWFITFIASFLTNIDSQLELLSGTMGQIVLAIVAFYFLGGVVDGGIKAFKK